MATAIAYAAPSSISVEQEIMEVARHAIRAAEQEQSRKKSKEPTALADSIALGGSVDRLMGALAKVSSETDPHGRMRILCILEGKAPEGSFFQKTMLRAIHDIRTHVNVPGVGFDMPTYKGHEVRPGLDQRLADEFEPAPRKAAAMPGQRRHPLKRYTA